MTSGVRPPPRPEVLLARLESVVGSTHVLADPALRAGYEVDWTGRFRGHALAVVRPRDSAEVAEVVALCADAGVGIVPQGGNTGLVGGGIPRDGSLVLSLRRLSALEPVDTAAGEATAGAGVTLAALQRQARSAGLEVGVDLAARDAATIGGMIATNAGGIRVLRHGTMRDQLAGIEAVLADGSVVRRLEAPRKDNTGYHLPSLLAGSEGTLAVITAARLRLAPALGRRTVALLALPDVDAAVTVGSRLRRDLPSLAAAELLFADGLDLVVRHRAADRPFRADHPAYLLVEAAGRADPTAELVAALADAPEVLDAAVAEEPGARERLWLLREAHSEAIAAEGVPHKLDVALPVARISRFTAVVRDRIASVVPAARTILYGHLLDGNLHVNVLGLEPDDDRVDDVVLRLTVEMGGAISAEHGVGIARTRWLPLDRSPAELAAMRAIKRALDPEGILNPGVLLPPVRPRREARR